MGELKITWNQTDTQAGIEREYQAFAQVQDYLDSLPTRLERIGELEQLHILLGKHSVIDVARALEHFKGKPQLHALSCICNNPKYMGRETRPKKLKIKQ